MRDPGSKNGTSLVGKGGRKRLTERFVDPRQPVSFGGYVERIGSLVEVDAGH